MGRRPASHENLETSTGAVPWTYHGSSIFVPMSEHQQLSETTDRSLCIEIPAAPAGGVEIMLLFAKREAHIDGRWPGDHDANTTLLPRLGPCPRTNEIVPSSQATE